MRIRVDWDFCQGHGVCCEEAPEVFALNDEGEMQLIAEEPDPSLRPKVERAVRFCPTRALSIQEES